MLDFAAKLLVVVLILGFCLGLFYGAILLSIYVGEMFYS